MTERHFVAQNLPQLHPVSCPVLDVEQNAKDPPKKIEQQIETSLWNASRSLAIESNFSLNPQQVNDELTSKCPSR